MRFLSTQAATEHPSKPGPSLLPSLPRCMDHHPDTLDYLLGSTYAIAWLAFLLTPVEVALHQIFDRAFKRTDGSRPLYTQQDRNLNAFWVAFGLGVAVMTFEAVIVTNSAHARDDMSEFQQLLSARVCACRWAEGCCRRSSLGRFCFVRGARFLGKVDKEPFRRFA